MNNLSFIEKNVCLSPIIRKILIKYLQTNDLSTSISDFVDDSNFIKIINHMYLNESSDKEINIKLQNIFEDPSIMNETIKQLTGKEEIITQLAGKEDENVLFDKIHELNNELLLSYYKKEPLIKNLLSNIENINYNIL